MEDLPISVIIPLSDHRKDFFYRFCLPSIEANNPKEIIIIDEEGSAPYKRNKGFRLSTQNFLFFSDDDAILGSDCLKKMLDAIEHGPEAFSYSHYAGIVTNKDAHPLGENFISESKPFDLDSLKKHNYIDTMSLVKREFFPGFDESLLGFQDWDLWLTIAEAGGTGFFIDDMLYMKFYFDTGISSDSERHKESKLIVKQKHKNQIPG